MKLNDDTIALAVTATLLVIGTVLCLSGGSEFNTASGFVELIRGVIKLALGGYILTLGWSNLRNANGK